MNCLFLRVFDFDSLYNIDYLSGPTLNSLELNKN